MGWEKIGSVFAGDVRHLHRVSARSRAKMAYIFHGVRVWGKKKKPAYPLGACRLLYHIFFYCFQFMFSQAMSLFNLFLNCWHITPFLNCLYLSIWYFKTVISSFLFINTSFLPMPRFGIKIFFSYNPLQRYAINMTWQNDARIVDLNYGKMLAFSAFSVTNVVLSGLKRAS